MITRKACGRVCYNTSGKQNEELSICKLAGHMYATRVNYLKKRENQSCVNITDVALVHGRTEMARVSVVSVAIYNICLTEKGKRKKCKHVYDEKSINEHPQEGLACKKSTKTAKTPNQKIFNYMYRYQ